MFGSRAIYHDGWKAVTFHPVGPLYDDGLNPNALLRRRRVGALSRGGRSLGDRGPGRSGAGAAGGHDRPVVARGGAQRRATPRQPAAVGAASTSRPTSGGTFGLPLLPRWGARSRVGGRARCRIARMPVRARHRRSRPGTSRTVCSLAVGSALGGWSLHFLDGHLTLRAQPLRQRPVMCWLSPEADRRGHARGGLRVHQRREPRRGGPAAGRRTPWWPRVSSTGSRAAGFNGLGVGLTCGYEWGPADRGRAIRRRSPSTARSTRAVVEVTGPVVRNPLAEIAAILAEQ